MISREHRRLVFDRNSPVILPKNSHPQVAKTTSSGLLKLSHVNAQSLLAHFEEFKLYYHTNVVHVIGVSETWLKPSVTSNVVSLPDFTLYRNDRETKRGGGVGLYIHSSLKSKRVGRSTNSCEVMLEYILVEIINNHSKMLIGVVYNPPKSNNLSDFEIMLASKVPMYDNVVIMGDFNIDISTRNVRSDILLNIIESSNLSIIPLTPTCHTKTTSTTLDLILVDDLKKVSSYGQSPDPPLSCHDQVYINYNMKTPIFEPKLVTFRDYKSFNQENFFEELSNINWCIIEELETIDEKVEALNSLLLTAFNAYVPLRTVRVTHPPTPWFTLDIKAKIKKRNELRALYRRSKSPTIFAEYKEIRNRVKDMVRKAKRDYCENAIRKRADSRTMWKTVRNLGVIS
ncbi:uncharacterized protein LOC124162953 [Ischnura elegans]|uniref:uncharacterized protein LOC124162953 n=1 Tax=Ischnura elegans TaxID=197161 RepID=UPI001ED86B66|nr:uncharacterized protein LOC124162953 [Ischnura elegans]